MAAAGVAPPAAVVLNRPSALRPSSLRRVVSLGWYEQFGTAKPAICPVCRYICVLSLVLSFPATLLCVAQLFPVLAAIDGPLLVDNAIRWLPHGLELEFNGTQLSLRPDRRARSDDADAEDDTLADLLLAHNDSSGPSSFLCWEDETDGDWCTDASG